MIGEIHARRVVDRVGVDSPAAQRVLDARLLGEAQVAALDHDLGAQLRGHDAARVVGVVANLRVGLVAGAHVGSDSAVVEQVDFSAQNRADQAVAVKLGGVDRKRGAHLRA